MSPSSLSTATRIVMALGVSLLFDGLTNASVKIYQDGGNMDHLGYMNCCMETNGEYFVMSHFLRPNDTVFDVGANIGQWSSRAYKAQKKIQLYAFEPVPAAYNELTKGLAETPASIHQLALGNKHQVLPFSSYKFKNREKDTDGSSRSSLFRHADVEKGHTEFVREAISVNATTIEQFCKDKGIEHIHFLKIDTEGAEQLVLLGAKNFLENKSIDYIQFEYGITYRGASEKLANTYKLLTSHGYTVFRILPPGPTPHQKMASTTGEIPIQQLSCYFTPRNRQYHKKQIVLQLLFYCIANKIRRILNKHLIRPQALLAHGLLSL